MNMQGMMQGAIFDMDGTLLDSMPVWDTLSEAYLLGKDIRPPVDLYEIIRPLSVTKTAEYFRAQLGLTLSTEEIVGEINGSIADKYIHEVLLKPYVREYLQQLKEAGVRMCVATATAKPLAVAALTRTGILPYFDFVLTCPEAGLHKDTPAFFQQALVRLQTPREETVVFEDALYAMRSAKAAGLYVVGVSDPSASVLEKEIRRTADQYIQGFEELIGV